ncbi:MAG: TolC family protein [Deinococcales bacterium]
MSPNRRRALGALVALALVMGPLALAQAPGLSLSDALAALPQSPSWQKADLDYQSAVDALAAARAGAGLRVSAAGSYDRTDTLAGPAGRNGSSAKVSVSASATVLPWAPTDASITNAQAALQVAALTRDSARSTLVITMEQQYFAARLAARARDVAQAALQQAQAKLSAAQAQHAQGQLSDQGLAQAQAAVASAQASLTQATGTLDLDRRTLFDTLGLPLSDATLTTAAPSASAPGSTLAQLVQSGVPKRDDVQTAQVRVRQAQDSLSATTTQRWIPAASLNVGVTGSDSTGSQAGLGVSADLDFQKGTLSGTASYPVAPAPVGNVSTQLSIGASVSIPLDAPSSDAAIRSGRTALASAKAALAATERSAELDIRQRYASYQAAQASLAADQASEATAKAALDTARARLTAGLAARLDVGDAQLAYRQAQRTVEADQNALYLALLQLRNALGELNATPGGTP